MNENNKVHFVEVFLMADLSIKKEKYVTISIQIKQFKSCTTTNSKSETERKRSSVYQHCTKSVD